jgi:hypothetical protein
MIRLVKISISNQNKIKIKNVIVKVRNSLIKLNSRENIRTNFFSQVSKTVRNERDHAGQQICFGQITNYIDQKIFHLYFSSLSL